LVLSSRRTKKPAAPNGNDGLRIQRIIIGTFIEQLIDFRFAEDEVRALCQTNPVRLLKLEAA
jgi:hypothetical protein